jgi:hypothetical protein
LNASVTLGARRAASAVLRLRLGPLDATTPSVRAAPRDAIQNDTQSARSEIVDRRRRASLEKYAARERVRRAVQAGRLVRPDRCEGCELSVPVQAHHDDYSKPLEVRWLCPACHVAIHVRERDCG